MTYCTVWFGWVDNADSSSTTNWFVTSPSVARRGGGTGMSGKHAVAMAVFFGLALILVMVNPFQPCSSVSLLFTQIPCVFYGVEMRLHLSPHPITYYWPRLKLWSCFYFAKQKGSITEWMGGEPEETEILEEKCIAKRGTRCHHHRHMWHHNKHDSWETNTQYTSLGKQNLIFIWIFVCICMHLCIYWLVYNTTISIFVCRHIELRSHYYTLVILQADTSCFSLHQGICCSHPVLIACE